MVVDAPSAPPVVTPAVMVTALAVVLVNTARPTLAVVCVLGLYNEASLVDRICGATSWTMVIVVVMFPLAYEGKNATVGATA